MTDGCALCAGPAGDAELLREEVWASDLWRLSMSVEGYATGFGYLEPKRHVPHIEDLDGEEATTFGPTLARVTTALKEAADAERVWIYIFGGGIPHLHVHLAPHREGDALNSAIIRGETDDVVLPSGAHKIVSREFAEVPAAEIRRVIVIENLAHSCESGRRFDQRNHFSSTGNQRNESRDFLDLEKHGQHQRVRTAT
jgi:diadenosine tetraphosphate (Ap4A) HIT family hydrolase